jgi:glycosyltransferase involved in cell wall biosynthesis
MANSALRCFLSEHDFSHDGSRVVSEKRRIAVFAHSLHAPRPRGVQRVARAVTEQIVQMLPENVEAWCLLEKIPKQPDLTYLACDLREFIASHPLVISENHGRLGRWKQRVRRFFELAAPPVVRNSFRGGLDVIRAITSRIPLTKRIHHKWQRILRFLGRAQPHTIPTQWMALEEFDVVIGFEAFDEIWNEPTHRCRTRLLCVFNDAIPKRIHEGVHWNPDRFDVAVTNACYRAHRMIAISRSAEDDLLTFFPPAAGKTQTVYLGHDVDRFSRGAMASRHSVDEVLAKHDISRNMPYLLVLGAVEPRKNISNILRACEDVRRHHPRLEFQLLLAGEISGQSEISQMLVRARKWLNVHVLRYVHDEDAAILVAQAKAVLYPSLWEGFGIPMFEAMSAGTLVVASDISSMPEVGGPHPIYCDPYDIKDLAEKFWQCLEMDELERRTRTAAAKKYSAQFTWRRTATKFMELINEELALATKVQNTRHTSEFERSR